MTKTIVYSCVFFDEKYINLIDLLLKSYKLFGNSSDNIDYLVICNDISSNKSSIMILLLNSNIPEENAELVSNNLYSSSVKISQ